MYNYFIFSDLFSEQSIIIIFCGFANLFVFNAIETVTTPLSLKFFDWKITANSIYYSSTALLVRIHRLVKLYGTKAYLEEQGKVNYSCRYSQ